ncbi:hypothetical protein OG875_00270 [Streptomyces sp. NBC_01498]|uniref:hypothetical protein n=1 Tax=Streptomyces sp. NBC_01498 TaxID=2975870 RepID=UPI002E7AC107|nr:hypothetical protein [Streptomyces sp. NBC_01498]WTL23164.1 hypothetical protein OG875_00270 [Streptomyces sp. NBC_01498]
MSTAFVPVADRRSFGGHVISVSSSIFSAAEGTRLILASRCPIREAITSVSFSDLPVTSAPDPMTSDSISPVPPPQPANIEFRFDYDDPGSRAGTKKSSSELGR